ncbi:C2 family cysteine protease [Cellulomonas xylanilytica]|uniref:Calpain catalytic domain-containing protein n=1 Tax=Cellulomonas xylanilytica TaxID=233583 RepID=A0A510V863_9CELL|nr:C2 family cysteine protease [Cellulomonas xylanilytica]GEK23044.1 hypothetical protein CXY01_35640 [Cellulomonas xylanilytica]
MSYTGFDVERLRTFAVHLRRTGSSVGDLRRDVAAVLDDAERALRGRPATSSPALRRTQGFLPWGLPSSLAWSLPEVAGSIERRCDHLEACRVLFEDGHHVHAHLAFEDAPPPDATTVQDALDALRGLADLDAGINGNRDDLRRIADLLAGLTAAELDLFLDDASADDLRAFGDAVADTSDSGWSPFDHNGLPVGERIALASTLLSLAGPTHLDDVASAFPWMTPGFDTTDVFLDGANPQTGEDASGITYGVPEGPLFADGVSSTDVYQGRLGDCWFIASLAASTQMDPDLIARNIRENPNGTISVRLWDRDGTERWVTMTRELPLADDGTPLGAHGDGELWPAYYEKAFALLYEGDKGGAPDGKDGDPLYDRSEQGTYGALEWDWTEKAPPYVSGNESRGLDVSFEDVQSAFDSGSPVIVASSDDKDDVPEHLQAGYFGRHVYYVTEITDDHVLLANPWGDDYEPLRLTPAEFEAHFDSPQAIDLGGTP